MRTGFTLQRLGSRALIREGFEEVLPDLGLEEGETVGLSSQRRLVFQACVCAVVPNHKPAPRAGEFQLVHYCKRSNFKTS